MSEAKKFRKKPVVVEATQFTEGMVRGDEPLPAGVRLARREIGPPPERRIVFHRHVIATLEGEMSVSVGDWIITGIKGERYPCKPDIFAATYEAVEVKAPVEFCDQCPHATWVHNPDGSCGCGSDCARRRAAGSGTPASSQEKP